LAADGQQLPQAGGVHELEMGEIDPKLSWTRLDASFDGSAQSVYRRDVELAS
jgi:hypothetical protein